MYKLARMHLDAVGSSSARFADLTLDFTDNEHNPLDSIVWLRNGGGKTSLLALLFSLFLPYRRDFLGAREDRRTLGDYVLSGDTAHVLCEWDTPSGPLVTGAVYEWPERRRPLEHEKRLGDLVTRFYAFNPKPGVLAFDLRPVHGEARKRRPLDAYVRELRAIGRAHPLTNLVVATTGVEWRQALTDRGIDSAVFKYQKEMNKGEGAIDEQFRFASGENFVSFLIEMVVDSEASDSVSERMGTLATKLAAKPQTRRELEYCEGVAERLGPIAGLWDDRARWQNELDGATGRAAELAGSLGAARDLAEVAVARAEETRAEAADRRTLAERARTSARDRGQEFARRAAKFWVDDATEHIASIMRAQRDVTEEQAGWSALGHLFELERAEAQIADIDRQLSAKAADSEPLRLARNGAARRLHWRYLAQQDSARGEHGEALVRAGAFDASARAHEEAAGAARESIGRLTSAVEGGRAQIVRIDEAVADAVAAGHLGRDVEPARALAETETAETDTQGAIERLEADVDRRSARQREITLAERGLSSEELAVRTARDADRIEADRLGAEAGALAAHERLRELAQSDQVSVWGAHQMLDGALAEEVARAEWGLVDEEVEAQRDRRNREALGEGGLLPPSGDTEAMLGVLSAAGIGAVSGLAYLSASVARRNWEDVIDAHPGLLSGILVDAGDFERARAALIEAEEHPASLVTLAPKSALEGDGESAFVVPPSAALYDQEAADVERVALDARLGDLDRRKALLQAGRDTDRALRERLRAFIEECPAGHLEGLARRIEAHDATLVALAARRIELETEDAEIASFLTGAAAQRSGLLEARVELAGRVQVLVDLSEQVARRMELEASIAADESALSEARVRLGDESRAATEDRRRLEIERRALATLETRIGDLDKALASVELRDDVEWGSAESDGPSQGIATEELQRDLLGREEEYSRAVSDPVLEDRRRRANEDRSQAQKDLSGHGAPALERATRLRETPAAADGASRTARVTELGRLAGELQRDRGLADADLNAADRRLIETTPSDRQVHRELSEDELPTSRADAEDRQALAEAEAQRQQLLVTKAADEMTAAVESGRAAKSSLDVLGVLVNALLGLVGPDVTEAGDVEAFAGSDEEAKGAHEAASTALRQARDAFEKTENRLNRAVADLRAFAGKEDFAAFGSLREPVVIGEVADVARRAAELAEAHHTRAAVLRSDLDSIAADQAILVTDLSGQVRAVLDLLKKAPQISVMDASLGEWANKSFLTITFDDVSAQPDELARRVSEEIDAIVAKGDTPEGLVTLQRAVRAAVPGGFKVRVLKPTADLHEERVSVSAMSKWSGGEKLTAAVVLYCIVARLRARQRSRQLPSSSSGALVLDNPLGKSNYVGFLAVQRRVAGALGVQLLYTTGVRDLKAVGTFPNVIRCRNRRSASTDRGYVVATERAGEAHGTTLENMGVVSSARVVRIDPATAVVSDEDAVVVAPESGMGDGAA